MKLSQLVHYLNCLDSHPLPDPENVCDRELGELMRVVRESQPNLPTRMAQLEKDREQIYTALQSFRSHVANTRQDVQQLIEGMQPEYFAESYRLHDQEMLHDTDQDILEREVSLPLDVYNYVVSRIAVHSDWRHAGMVIRPGRGEWLNNMVGCDPLYLIDIRSSLLDPCMAQFPPEYQRRLRRYAFKEKVADGRVLRNLPDGQFGICVAMNFFQFKPLELIKVYLIELYSKLRPGGILALTFNDCDRANGVALVEQHFMCYTPGSMLLTLAESLGFEISQLYRLDGANTWVELRKPGTLTSIKGGQTLAKIVANS
jgi:hypothetical protein